MIIFLKNIPVQTKHSDIAAFIKPAMKAGLFGKKGVVENIKVLQLKDARTNISEYHGLVTMQPDSAAKKVIKRLNRKKFLNKYIAVEEYQRRDWHNDPRLNDMELASKPSELRIADRRRRSIEVVEDMTDKFSSNKTFYRHH